MTVSELIEKLKDYNPLADVYIYTGDVNLIELNEVEHLAPSIVFVS